MLRQRRGTYRGDWQLYDLNGESFGPEVYLEIEVVGPDPEEIDETGLTMLFDFIKEAEEATWASGEVSYSLLETDISDDCGATPFHKAWLPLALPSLRGNVQSDGNVLLDVPGSGLPVFLRVAIR